MSIINLTAKVEFD